MSGQRDATSQAGGLDSAALNAPAATDAIIPVEGMSCSACAARIKGALKELPGVQLVEVDLLNRNVKVRYLSTQTESARLVEVINKLGYKARLPEKKSGSKAETAAAGELAIVTLQVHGMACEACVQGLEERIGGISGVTGVRVSLPNKQARIEFVEQKVSAQQLLEAIESAGFSTQGEQAAQ